MSEQTNPTKPKTPYPFFEYLASPRHSSLQLLYPNTNERPIPSTDLSNLDPETVRLGGGSSANTFLIKDVSHGDFPLRTVYKVFNEQAQFDNESIIIFVIEYTQKKLRRGEPDYIHYYIPHFYQRYRSKPYFYIRMEYLCDKVSISKFLLFIHSHPFILDACPCH